MQIAHQKIIMCAVLFATPVFSNDLDEVIKKTLAECREKYTSSADAPLLCARWNDYLIEHHQTPIWPVEDASGCYEWRGQRICKDPNSVSTQNAETDDQRMTKVAETCVDYVHSLAGRGWWFASFQAYWDPGIREFQYMQTTPAESFEFRRCLITQGVRPGPAHLMPEGQQ
jgi:hypothetical protein